MNRLKTLLCLWLAAALLLSAAASSAQSGPDIDAPTRSEVHVKADPALHALLPADIRKSGRIVVGTNPNTPPTIYYDEDNKTLLGREVDIMTAITQRLGIVAVWRNIGGFDNIIPGLSTGRYQAALANIEANPVRLKRLDFVAYFDSNRFALLAQAEPSGAVPPPITDLALLCGQTVGAGSGTGNLVLLEKQSARCVAEGKAAITIPVFPSRPAGTQAVVSGRIPGFLGPYEGIRHTVLGSRGKLRTAGVFTQPTSRVSVALAKGSPLTEPVRLALESLIRDGSYGRILARWDLSYGAVTQALSNESIHYLEKP